MKVTPKGRKVFLVMYRLAGAGSRLRKYTIGPYGRVTLPMAKAQAQKIFAARIDGRDPAEEKKQSRRRLVVDRLDDLVETFIREHVAKIGTSRRITSLLRRDVIPYWGAKSIHEIKKRDVSDLASLIAQRNAHASHRLLKTLKTFFRWCVGRAVIDFSPAEGKRKKKDPRRFPTMALVVGRAILNLSFFSAQGIQYALRPPTPNEGEAPLDLAIADISGPYWKLLAEGKGKTAIDLDNWREPRWARAKMMVAAGYPDEHKTRVTVGQEVMLGVPFTLLAAEKKGRLVATMNLLKCTAAWINRTAIISAG